MGSSLYLHTNDTFHQMREKEVDVQRPHTKHQQMEDKKEKKKVVLITGCTKGGIGFEYCKAFAEQKCRVVASDLQEHINNLSEDLSFSSNYEDDGIEAIELDVSSDESVESAVSTIIQKHGRIDILINNAGIGSTGALAEMPLQEVKKAWEVNALGQLRMVQRVVPYMAARRSGVVVNIGSVVGTVPTPWAGSYCASKAAVHAMSNSLRVELRPFGIDVVLVMPGAVRSNFGRANAERLRRHDGDWKLYREFKEAIAERAKASQGGKATDATVFARYVARKVLRPRPPKQVVFGHMTGLFAVLSWSPLWVRDTFFSNRFKLKQ